MVVGLSPAPIRVLFVRSVKPFTQSPYPSGKPSTAVSQDDIGPPQAPHPPVWEGRAIATHKLRLVEFTAFMESQNRDEPVRALAEL